MGYCTPSYQWISNSEVFLVCHTDKNYIAKENSFMIKVNYEIGGEQ